MSITLPEFLAASESGARSWEKTMAVSFNHHTLPSTFFNLSPSTSRFHRHLHRQSKPFVLPTKTLRPQPLHLPSLFSFLSSKNKSKTTQSQKPHKLNPKKTNQSQTQFTISVIDFFITIPVIDFFITISVIDFFITNRLLIQHTTIDFFL